MSFRVSHLLLLVCFCVGICTGQQAKEKAPHGTEGQSERTVDQDFPTPLLRAIVKREGVTVRVLLHKGVDPNPPKHCKLLEIPIVLATDVSDFAILRLLLDAGAKIDAQDDSGLDALMVATLKGNVELVEFLLAHKANPNIGNSHGVTALTIAARDRQIEIVRHLLKAGADVNQTAEGGVTTLMCAADDDELVEALLHAGAKLDLEDGRGRTAVCYAETLNQPKKLAVLQKNGANTDPQCKAKMSRPA